MRVIPPLSSLQKCVVLIGLLVGCSSPPPVDKVQTVKPPTAPQPIVTAPAPIGFYFAPTVSGDYAGYPALNQFIERMVAEHGFSREYLNGLFSQAKRKQWTLDYFAKSDKNLHAPPGQGSWSRYRSQFLDAKHIDTGIRFWHRYRQALERADREYGVAPEYILGIMAVETTFGGFVGNHRVLDALTTLAFDFKRRGDYFRSELENYLLMARNEGLDPGKPVGSFAGAMGLGQFMPSSFLQWAVDFNGDGRRDLWHPEDSIGSVARYFAEHGWQSGQPVVSLTRGGLSGGDDLETGLQTRYTLADLLKAELGPVESCRCDYPLQLLLLRHTQHDEYRLGHPNFYVITRYNQSTHYAMAVHELAQAIKSGYLKTLNAASQTFQP